MSKHIERKACEYCGLAMPLNPGESPSEYAKRRFHDRACANMSRRIDKGRHVPLPKKNVDPVAPYTPPAALVPLRDEGYKLHCEVKPEHMHLIPHIKAQIKARAMVGALI